MTNNARASSARTLRMIYAAMYLGIALVLPFVTGQIPEIGKMLSPMHIPVLLCGFMCGWPWGLAVGLIAPPLRSVLFGMPVMMPGAVSMSFELATYGLVSGILYRCFPRKNKAAQDPTEKRNWKKPARGELIAIYATLIAAMLAGRVVWGLARWALAGAAGGTFTMALFWAGAFTEAVPGIILHLVLIPALVAAMERAGLALD